MEHNQTERDRDALINRIDDLEETVMDLGNQKVLLDLQISDLKDENTYLRSIVPRVYRPVPVEVIQVYHPSSIIPVELGVEIFIVLLVVSASSMVASATWVYCSRKTLREGFSKISMYLTVYLSDNEYDYTIDRW